MDPNKVAEKETESSAKSEELLQAVFNAFPDMVVRVNKQGLIMDVKPATTFMPLIPKEGLLGKRADTVLPHEIVETYRPRILEAFATKEMQVFEYPVVKRGLTQYREARVVPFSEEEVIVLIRDVTQTRQLNQIRMELISFASHQLRSPLSEINGLAANLLQGLGGPLTPKQKEYAAFIEQISSRYLRLVNNLLSVERIEQGIVSPEIEPVSLEDAVRALVERYRESVKAKGLKLFVEGLENKVSVMGDFQKSSEAMRNVLENAIRYTREGAITVRLKKRETSAVVEIEDTGPGIPEFVIPKLFTKALALAPLPGMKGQGSGLGLYIAKRFMTVQGGDLTADVVPGKGSRFIFKWLLRPSAPES